MGVTLMPPKPLFSLVMATRGRVLEIREFLESLLRQECKDFDLTIVDQNDDERLRGLVEEFSPRMSIKWLRVNVRGLSVSRNVGLKEINGEIIAFPDDDCIYPPDLLRNIATAFTSSAFDLVSVKSVDEESQRSSNGYWKRHPQKITSRNVIGTIVSYSFFVRATALKSARFDERLGVGAYFGAAEEIDFVLQLLQAGASGYYFSNWHVYHPNKTETSERSYNYALGFGAMIKKNMLAPRCGGINLLAIEHGCRSVGGFVFSLAKGDTLQMRHYCRVIWGRMRGWWEYKNDGPN